MEILDSIISIKNSFLIYVDLIKFKLNTPGYLLATNSTSLKGWNILTLLHLNY